MKKKSFSQEEKILKRKDFSTAYNFGKRLSSSNFIVYLYPNPNGTRRLGITVGKKIGNAVHRNRIKRLLREFFRLNKDRLPEGQDFVIVSRRDASDKKFEEVKQELERLLISAEAVRDTAGDTD
jgi:ribonuclease P protein component